MLPGHRPQTWPNFLFLALLVALNFPNFLWLSPYGTDMLNSADFVEKLLPGLLLGACFLALFRYPWRAWLALWLLCLWWQPLAIGVRIINGTGINATLVGMAFATSPSELRELATAIPQEWLAFLVLWNLICLGVLHILLQRRHWYWTWLFRSKVIFFCVCMLALPYVVAPRIHEADIGRLNTPPPESNYSHTFGEGDQNTGITAYLPEAYPYELPRAVAQYWQARRVVDIARSHLKAPNPAYTLNETQLQADIAILIIGESSTRNAWHWFNHEAPETTPRLEARVMLGESLFGFTRTLAQTTSTRQAVPSILTAQPLIWPSGKANSEATYGITHVAAEAGYATAWFSNQAAVGKHDGIVASYAQEAAAMAFLNPSSFADKGSFDAVLLPALRRHLARNSRAFVVLHTLGSHFNYIHRYPSGFGPYPQSNDAREAYFNSIAYTDWILDQAINILASDGRKAVLVYISDHGEAVPGGACKSNSASRTTRDAYEVPALVWLSSSYAQAHPAMVERLRAYQNEPYTVAAVHQTLLDLMRADALAPLPDPETQSFARPARRRSVNAGELPPAWTTKFEEAVAKNPCFRVLP